MNERLTKGCYGGEFGQPPADAPFGLRCGQMRLDGKIGHNHGWYNAKGEKLGFGDLSTSDAVKLMSELRLDEAFITLCESASYWDAHRNGVDVQNPGLEYVLSHAAFVFVNGQAFRVDQFSSGAAGKPYKIGDDGLEVTPVSVPFVWALLAERCLIPKDQADRRQAEHAYYSGGY